MKKAGARNAEAGWNTKAAVSSAGSADIVSADKKIKNGRIAIIERQTEGIADSAVLLF